jgi:trimeric autotransporter adhesin
MKIPIRFFENIFALLCLALLSTAQAVIPPPDGGYPGFNTAEGDKALFSLTTGTGNTAVGWFSLFSNTDGSFNTGVGAGTLLFNVGNQSVGEGISNTGIGTTALLFNTSGSNNTAVGTTALLNNTSGNSNAAVGADALQMNTTGTFNNAFGAFALFFNQTGGQNNAFGAEALQNNVGGIGNTAMGDLALHGNVTGDENVAVGDQAMQNANGDNNTAVGAITLSNNVGNANTGIGRAALVACTTGDFNTAIGADAASAVTSGGSNVIVGRNAGVGITTANNVICIGADLAGENISNSCFIRNIFSGAAPSGAGVLVSSNGRLGTTTSSRRFKEQIEPMEQASEALFALKPVTFRYKNEIDPRRTQQFGLVAEEVEAINPDLIVRDKEGKPYSVRYEQVNAMLLNEFLKEHKKVEEQQATIAELEKGMAVLAAQLKEQAAEIQKISA